MHSVPHPIHLASDQQAPLPAAAKSGQNSRKVPTQLPSALASPPPFPLPSRQSSHPRASASSDGRRAYHRRLTARRVVGYGYITCTSWPSSFKSKRKASSRFRVLARNHRNHRNPASAYNPSPLPTLPASSPGFLASFHRTVRYVYMPPMGIWASLPAADSSGGVSPPHPFPGKDRRSRRMELRLRRFDVRAGSISEVDCHIRIL